MKGVPGVEGDLWMSPGPSRDQSWAGFVDPVVCVGVTNDDKRGPLSACRTQDGLGALWREPGPFQRL